MDVTEILNIMRDWIYDISETLVWYIYAHVGIQWDIPIILIWGQTFLANIYGELMKLTVSIAFIGEGMSLTTLTRIFFVEVA